MFKLFCKKDHSPEQENINYSQDLLEAKARLARLKKMPESAFAEKSHKQMGWSFGGGPPTTYSVDNKVDAIARCEAEIAELEVLVEGDSPAQPYGDRSNK